MTPVSEQKLRNHNEQKNQQNGKNVQKKYKDAVKELHKRIMKLNI